MKIKWNWGTGIFIAIVVMMLFVGLLVFKSFGYKINKVSDDYYEKGLHHTEQMNKVKNSAALKDGFDVIYGDDCTIQFPDFFKDKEAIGTILFFRPSDYSDDRSFQIAIDSLGMQHITLDYFKKGKYIVKVNVKLDRKSYYFEKEIVFN